MPFDTVLIVQMLVVSLITGLTLCGLSRLWARRAARIVPRRVQADRQAVVFLFDGTRLVDASAAARQVLSSSGRAGAQWVDVWAALKPRFPDLPRDPQRLTGQARLRIRAGSVDDPGRIDVESWGSTLRLTLTGQADAPGAGAAPELIHSLAHERDMLAGAVAGAPEPMWKTDAAGRVLWANPAYSALAARVHPDCDGSETGLVPALFDRGDPETAGDGRRRVALNVTDTAQKAWFDVSWTAADHGAWFGHATDVGQVVQAEIAQRNFVQTLTKTFAHLSIGLAIFDKKRRLALFNPALIDLTGLAPEFLSARPGLQSFFDHLRDHQILPEPKDYVSWRDRISDLVMAAANGTYNETWTLATGQTYRLSGRPHPDGAIAFLLEDISAEVSLTRRFRAEMEQNQLVLDTLTEALAVFSADGVLTMTNAAYRALWDSDPASSFAPVTIVEATRDWMAACAPSPVWGDLRDFVVGIGDRAPWQADLRLSCGQPLACSVSPIAGGGTLVGFHPGQAAPVSPPQAEVRPTETA